MKINIDNNLLAKNILRLLTFFLIILLQNTLYAQKSITVKYIEHNEITIDGELIEEEWQHTEVSSGFNEFFPTDDRAVEYQTEVSMLYNEQYLYIGIKAYAPGTDYKTPSYQRDFSISGADVINLMFDTYNDRTNAFLFGINQFGVLREGLISNGGITGNLDLSWDTKWVGESTIYEKFSISEIRIPMSSFKFKEGVTQWKFNAMRSNTQPNTKSSWSRVPQNQDQLNLGYFGDMVFEKPLGKSRTPISIIPYITPTYQKDNKYDEEAFTFEAGVDVKIPVSNSFMLDLTINPDFSSADVIAGENNITRFEIKRDETRQFFIDNGDLFNNFGLEDDALAFYSRRVGVGNDTSNNSVFVPINAGAKFTGKINNKFRVGVLDIQTKGNPNQLIASNNNLVLAAEHRVFAKSNISFFLVNRQVTNPGTPYSGTEYNRVAGSDFRFFSKNNDFDAHAFIHKSLTPEIGGNAVSTGTDINLLKRHYTLSLTGQYIDDGYHSDLGYTRRKDIIRTFPYAEFKMYPKVAYINTINIKTSYDAFWVPSLDYKHTDSDILLGGEINFTNGARVGLNNTFRYVYLNEPFDPIGGDEDNIPLPLGEYHTQDLEFEFNTDKRKAFWFEGSSTIGSFYSGNKFTTDATFQYRFQPIFYISFKVQYDDIKLPEPYASDQLWYLGPTLNFTFTKSLFWNTDIQYSTQANSMLLVSRVQWRYAPLSDIYLTYTDTYNTKESSLIERGIYLRVSYWFDIKR